MTGQLLDKSPTQTPSGALIVIQSLPKIIYANVFYWVLLMSLCQRYLPIANSHIQAALVTPNVSTFLTWSVASVTSIPPPPQSSSV